MDAWAVRKRIETRESVLPKSAPSVSRLASSLLAFLAESESEGSVAARARLLRDLDQIELEYEKTRRMQRACEEETANYETLSQDVSKIVAKTASEVEELKLELKRAKLERQKKEACETLAKVVNREKPRHETSKEIEALYKELEALKRIKAETEEKFSLRRKQFHLLLHSIMELKQDLAEDQVSENDDDENDESENTAAPHSDGDALAHSNDPMEEG